MEGPKQENIISNVEATEKSLGTKIEQAIPGVAENFKHLMEEPFSVMGTKRVIDSRSFETTSERS
jgi:hypothetical protein